MVIEEMPLNAMNIELMKDDLPELAPDGPSRILVAGQRFPVHIRVKKSATLVHDQAFLNGCLPAVHLHYNRGTHRWLSKLSAQY